MADSFDEDERRRAVYGLLPPSFFFFFFAFYCVNECLLTCGDRTQFNEILSSGFVPGSTDEDLEASEYFQRFFWEHLVINEDSYSPTSLNQVEQAAVCSVEEQSSPVEDSFTNPLE